MILIKRQQGLTVIELLITLAIFSLIIGAIFSFIRLSLLSQSQSAASVSAGTEGRQAITKMTQDLRGAIQSETGSYPIESSSNNAITFYTNTDSDNAAEKVRYFLSGTNLQRGVIQPQGSPATYPLASEQVKTLARYIRNGATPIFTFYDRNYTGTQNPINPNQIGEIRFVKINLILDNNPNRPPLPFNIQSEVELRNLKDNL